MGAGSGWLAYLLRDKGASVDAYDALEGATFIEGWQVWPWSRGVQKGSEDVLLSEGKVKEARTLLLCWPELEAGFATACLGAYRGVRFVFIGEGRGGSTAEDSFFDTLEASWVLEVSFLVVCS